MKPLSFAIPFAIAAALVFAPGPNDALAHGKGDAQGVVALDVASQGNTIDVLVAVRQGGATLLVHRRSTDGGANWSGDHPIEPGPGGLVTPHRGNEPQIATSGDHLVVTFTRPGESRYGSGPLGTAVSRDGGATWTRGPNPADDGGTGGHGYVGAATAPDGAVYLAWLDSRDGGQGVRAAVSRDGGQTWSANASADTRTCECCWNDVVAPAPGTAFVLYRDKDPRDMVVAATKDAGRTWTRTAAAGAFGWGIDGCPHVGGALASTRSGADAVLHALVFTGQEGQAGLHLVTSHDGAASWTKPQRLGGPKARNGGLAGRGKGLAAAWDEAGVVKASASDDEGVSFGTPRTLTAPGVSASHPLVVATADGFRVFWTEAAAGGQTVVQSAALD